MSKRPHNGPTFTKAPPKKRRPITGAASPSIKEAEQEEASRTAAKSRRFDQLKNEVGLLEALRRDRHLPPKKDSGNSSTLLPALPRRCFRPPRPRKCRS